MAKKQVTKKKGKSTPVSAKGGGSSARKPSAARQQEIDFDRAPAKSKKKSDHKALKGATPYILILVGLILLICFFTVHILKMDEGVGVVGYWIQWFFCGLFGLAAFLTPLVLIYVGIKWCLYNIKKKGARDEDDEDELVTLRKRNVLQTVMACLLVVLFAALVGVFADEFDSFDIGDMFLEGGDDLVGGGLIGGVLSVLMVMGFEAVISTIILIFFIALAVILMLGLTPDRIIIYAQYKRKLRKERRLAELEEEVLLEEEARREEAKHNSRIKASRRADDEDHYDDDEPEEIPEERKLPAKRSRARSAGMSVDEMMNEPSQDAVSDVYADTANEGEILTPTEENNEKSDNIISLDPAELIGEDFGGDPVFDNPEFSGISGVIENLKTENEINIPAEQTDESEDIDMELIVNEELLSDIAAVAPDELDEEPVEVETPYVFPPMEMLTQNPHTEQTDFTKELQENAKILMETLRSFKVSIREITYSRGPTITRYELKPEAGTRVRAIANLVDDIALNLATSGVRIEAPIPNKPAVGIEVPNRERATVYLRDLIESAKFSDAKSKLTASLGMDVGGNPIYFDIAKMPHLLIAGATGMGKSVCINSIIVSILYKAKPDEVKLILVDPKKVEFNIYKDIPHLYAPIVSDPKKAAGALASAVAEMERRFELIEEVGVRDIATYNAVTENDPTKEFMPQMVIIIDELADLMMTAPDEVEASICRLAQKARAAGIHIVIGTQRPSVDVITGLIKANIPSRIACTVASQIDSRTILDMAGAEKLIGRGDMLFAPVGASKPMRVQGAFVSEAEVERIVTFIKENNVKAKYNSDFVHMIEEEAAKCGAGKKGASGGDGFGADGADSEGGDSKFRDAVKLAIDEGKISTSLMQRRLGVGYGRAAKIIDTMEEMGYVSKPDGNKPRRVLITMEEYMNRVVNNSLGGENE